MPQLRRYLIAVMLAAACFAQVGVVEACPGCAEAQAGQGPGRAGIVQGYQLSIVFMMAMPFLIVGSFGGYVYYSVRKAREEQQSPPGDRFSNDADGNRDAVGADPHGE
jgi:heme/copper-type cytochrome/quinol oxidase subunit 2